jgi:zinc/manganese transport system ATP-binding protein
MTRPVGELRGAGQPGTGQPNAGQPGTGQPGTEGKPGELLDVQDVSLWLSGRKILDDVSFALRPGEFTALIGSNGAGKTTLLRVILGLQAPSAGTVRVAGQPRTRRGSLIGYVPQKILLDPDMPLRARDLVGLGLDGQRLGLPLPSARRRHQVDEMLHAVGADQFGDTRVGRLSGGEQQRVLIAHALISRPRLLLLDEPLANLDIASEQDVVELLGRVAREQQIAVLISAHDMNPLLPFMDRIVYMAAGRAASGTTAEVVRPEVLSELYGQHVDVIRVHGRILVVAAARGVGLEVPQPEPEPVIHGDA